MHSLHFISSTRPTNLFSASLKSKAYDMIVSQSFAGPSSSFLHDPHLHDLAFPHTLCIALHGVFGGRDYYYFEDYLGPACRNIHISLASYFLRSRIFTSCPMQESGRTQVMNRTVLKPFYPILCRLTNPASSSVMLPGTFGDGLNPLQFPPSTCSSGR